MGLKQRLVHRCSSDNGDRVGWDVEGVLVGSEVTGDWVLGALEGGAVGSLVGLSVTRCCVGEAVRIFDGAWRI